MRLIDADELLVRLPDDLPYKGAVKRVLAQAPTVDTVPVVRCGDCEKWWHNGLVEEEKVVLASAKMVSAHAANERV